MHDTAEQPTRLSITHTAGMRFLALSGEVDADYVDLLRQALQTNHGGPAQTVLDLGGVTFVDSRRSACWPQLTAMRRLRTAGSGWRP
ncbi:STAS domain-containing protein [Streptomyces sp. NPDC060027]|uniref:STAS domain-containing protein n=1 Tax=Streptomyces sp. NPDC060027 TaxID=3347040 RepID=UPI0036A6561B